MKIELVRPTIELKEKAIEYRKEHFKHDELIINGSELFDKIDSYEEWLEKVNNNSKIATVDPNWVLTDTFFAIRKEDNKIIGIIDLRHTLNDFLKIFGNCGYSVRPSERQKGYATEMLRLLLEYAKEIGLKEIHLSVERTNNPSIKTIVKNGGKLERSFKFEGKLVDSYLIKL
ncbi:MAG: GNAT family N-acetyltransferase [Bacilli bacterium]|nr:GNAT family N-acetyltransferase [Bacilli bacterium]